MKDWNRWLDEYYGEYQQKLYSDDLKENLKKFMILAEDVKSNRAKMMFAGNGASAAISAHGAVDFSKQAGVRGITFNEADLITCFANDFGYENWIAKSVEMYGDPNDVVVLTSVSGQSPNVIEAAKVAREMNLPVVTFTGKSKDNDLKKLGTINFWVNSNAYNIVECIHMIWLTTVVDMVIGESVYSV